MLPLYGMSQWPMPNAQAVINGGRSPDSGDSSDVDESISCDEIWDFTDEQDTRNGAEGTECQNGKKNKPKEICASTWRRSRRTGRRLSDRVAQLAKPRDLQDEQDNEEGRWYMPADIFGRCETMKDFKRTNGQEDIKTNEEVSDVPKQGKKDFKTGVTEHTASGTTKAVDQP